MAARAALALVVLVVAPLASAEPVEVHGESDVFAARGVAMAWGVLRGASEADTQVVLRVVPLGGAWGAVSVEAVDPFSRERREAMPRRPFTDPIEVRRPRASFSDFPRLEIHFHAAAGAPRDARPALTVYYLGVPDTTPEFQSEAALAAHLASALARARPPR